MKIKTFLAVGIAILGLGLADTTAWADRTSADIYQRDYLQKVYDSEQGMDGSAANCIYAAEDGVLWIGNYAGLFSYDSHEFVTYKIGDYAISVNAVTQDPQGNLWIGTNGNGLYYYDGETFTECHMDSEETMAYTINELCMEADGTLWVAAKRGLYVVDTTAEEKQAVHVSAEIQEEIRDLCILPDERKALVSRTGTVYVIDQDGTVRQIDFSDLNENVSVRCIADTSSSDIYLGTNGSQILHLKADGTFVRSIDVEGLESFNQIYEFQDGQYWVCSDSGIGVMENDIVTPMDYKIYNSVEAVCEDYQGNYWFASSRQGVMQICENYFSDLSTYMGFHQTVNSMETCGDLLYIGSDNGLYCYRDREPVAEDPLVTACAGQRIRQVYMDNKGRLWVVTYRMGLVRKDPDGSITVIHEGNSGLTTNSLRCIYERMDGSFLIGTEEGIFCLNKKDDVIRLVQNENFNEERILSIAEDRDGTVYAGTDGDGIYVIENGEIIRNTTMKDGLLSNVILKMKPSVHEKGIWVVTGGGVCFGDQEQKILAVTGVDIANSLDLIFLNDEEIAILAGNGFFRMTESDLLEKKVDSFIHYDKQLGLPVDFTANAWNIVRDGVLYMCGTDGAASLDLNREPVHKEIRTYVNDIEGDQKSLYRGQDITVIDADTHRLNLDVRILNYTHDNYNIRFMLEGTDEEASRIKDSQITDISYTNLRGGNYVYHFEVLDETTDEVLAEQIITLKKKLTLWEEPYIRLLLLVLAVGVISLMVYGLLIHRDKELQERYRKQYMKEHREEVEKIAFQDMVTGVNNRNSYERDKQHLDMKKLWALSTVSINHAEYLRNKYGILHFEDILKKTAQLLITHTESGTEIYRISEYIFCVWFREPVDIEAYIQLLKADFEEIWKDEEDASTLAVGAVYCDRLMEEDYRSLFKRCDDMRILDQKHEEMQFMDRKIRYMNFKNEKKGPDSTESPR